MTRRSKVSWSARTCPRVHERAPRRSEASAPPLAKEAPSGYPDGPPNAAGGRAAVESRPSSLRPSASRFLVAIAMFDVFTPRSISVAAPRERRKSEAPREQRRRRGALDDDHRRPQPRSTRLPARVRVPKARDSCARGPKGGDDRENNGLPKESPRSRKREPVRPRPRRSSRGRTKTKQSPPAGTS